MERIPSKVLSKVFLKLLIKDILECKCVCKEWLSIISSSRFAKYHLDTSSNTTKNRILIKHKRVESNGYAYEYVGLRVKSNGNAHKYERLPFTDEETVPKCLSSCHGMLLVGTGIRNHFLWNPATGSYRQLRFNMYHCREDVNGRYMLLYGLGYDSISQAYKVIRIVSFTCTGGYKLQDFTGVRVYNCKTERCKKIDNFPYKPVEDGQGAIVNGTPHWIVTRKDNEKEHAIIYFDMAEDVIKEVETRLPSWLQVEGSKFRFGVSQNSLCLVKCDEGGVAEVWVMKEHISWARLVKITTMQQMLGLNIYDVFGKIAKDSVTFRRIKNSDTLSFDGPVNDTVFDTITYVATLVSPKFNCASID